MPTPLFHRRVVSSKIISPGAVTRARVHVRAHELAVLAGHIPPYVAQAEYEQAKREVTGESDLERQEAMLDSVPGPA